jgi:hypothetical protein
MENTKSLLDLLTWLIYSGGAILVSSWVLDRIAKYQLLPVDVKKGISMAVSAALALGAYAVITYVPASIFVVLDPWFKIIAGIVVLYGGQQLVHQASK